MYRIPGVLSAPTANPAPAVPRYSRPPVSRQAARNRPKTAAPPAQPKPSRARPKTANGSPWA